MKYGLHIAYIYFTVTSYTCKVELTWQNIAENLVTLYRLILYSQGNYLLCLFPIQFDDNQIKITAWNLQIKNRILAEQSGSMKLEKQTIYPACLLFMFYSISI